MIASFVSGRPTVLFDPKTRKCVQRASSRPPPSAVEERAETVGTWRAARSRNVPLNFAKNAFVLLESID